MKKRNLLILACGALLAGATLTACAANQSAVENGQSKTIGFMQLANEDKQKDVADKKASPSTTSPT